MEIPIYRMASGQRRRKGGDNGDPCGAILVFIVALVCYFMGSIINEAMIIARNRTWQYCTVFITPEEDMRKVINQYGSEGWFMCGQDADDASKYYFRR